MVEILSKVAIIIIKGGGMMAKDERLLASAKRGTRRVGKDQLIKWLEGKKLGWGQAIKAKCYDCSGMGEDPICLMESCPLLPFSPYREKGKKGGKYGRWEEVRSCQTGI